MGYESEEERAKRMSAGGWHKQQQDAYHQAQQNKT